MSHLGDRVSAFVDDQLSLAEQDRVGAHLARCAGCRAEVEAQREVKARLGGMAAPVAPARVLEALRGLPVPGQELPARAAALLVRPTARGPVGARRPVSPRPGRGPSAGRWWSGPVRRRAVAGALALGAVVVVAAAGGGGEDGPLVRPPVDRFAVEHASVTGGVPLVDPASLVEVGRR